MVSYSLKNRQGCLHILSFVFFIREKREMARTWLLKVVKNFPIIKGLCFKAVYNISLQQDTKWFCWIGGYKVVALGCILFYPHNFFFKKCIIWMLSDRTCMLKCFIVPTIPFCFLSVQYSRLVCLFGPLEAFKFEHLARRYSTNSGHPDTFPCSPILT